MSKLKHDYECTSLNMPLNLHSECPNLLTMSKSKSVKVQI